MTCGIRHAQDRQKFKIETQNTIAYTDEDINDIAGAQEDGLDTQGVEQSPLALLQCSEHAAAEHRGGASPEQQKRGNVLRFLKVLKLSSYSPIGLCWIRIRRMSKGLQQGAVLAGDPGA